MELKSYLTEAKHSLVLLMSNAHLLIGYVSLFHHVAIFLRLWQYMFPVSLYDILKVRGVIDTIKMNIIHHTHIITLSCSHSEILLLCVEVLIYVLHSITVAVILDETTLP